MQEWNSAAAVVQAAVTHLNTRPHICASCVLMLRVSSFLMVSTQTCVLLQDGLNCVVPYHDMIISCLHQDFQQEHALPPACVCWAAVVARRTSCACCVPYVCWKSQMHVDMWTSNEVLGVLLSKTCSCLFRHCCQRFVCVQVGPVGCAHVHWCVR